MDWQPLLPQRFKLAEGPFWDQQTQALYWVDIAGFKACRLHGERYQEWQLDRPCSAFVPTVRGDALVTLPDGVFRLDLDSPESHPALELFCVADPDPGNRGNEARCDAQGRLWLGTMQNNLDAEGGDVPIDRHSGGLFRIDPDGSVSRHASDLGIANTLVWSAADNHVISADTLKDTLYRYPLDASGNLGEPTVWAGPHERGSPDGSAIDSEGCVWNARWDGNCLLRFSPEGELLEIVELPVQRPTSCVFGGPDLRTLYVTSAAADGALDGALLRATAPVAGMPCHRFAG